MFHFNQFITAGVKGGQGIFSAIVHYSIISHLKGRRCMCSSKIRQDVPLGMKEGHSECSTVVRELMTPDM